MGFRIGELSNYYWKANKTSTAVRRAAVTACADRFSNPLVARWRIRHRLLQRVGGASSIGFIEAICFNTPENNEIWVTDQLAPAVHRLVAQHQSDNRQAALADCKNAISDMKRAIRSEADFSGLSHVNKYSCLKYKYKYKYQSLKYEYKYKYWDLKYKYKYKYFKFVLEYNSSTSTSTKYYMSAGMLAD